MKKYLLFAGIILFFLLAGCDNRDKFHDLKEHIDQLKQTIELKQKPSSVKIAHQLKPASYQKELSRTPFEETRAATDPAGAAANPLSRYPLTLLRFVGTVVQPSGIIAYISTPDNKIYEAAIGVKIGDRGGTLSKISSTQLEISEPASDTDKTETQRIVTLQLKDEAS